MGIKQINILGINYKVEEKDQIDKNKRVLGEIDYIEQTIKLEKDLSDEKKTQVLIHEIIHGIFEELGFENENENEHLIQALAVALYQTLKSNNINV